LLRGNVKGKEARTALNVDLEEERKNLYKSAAII